MRIILDTGVFWRPAALAALRQREETLIVPAVAYAERRRQLARRGLPPALWDDQLESGHFVVEAFGRSEAVRVPSFGLGDAAWARLARDAFIAAHVGAGDVLWTTNPRDFLALGLSRNQIQPVP